MNSKRLGQTGLKISSIVLGTMQMGWIVSEEESHKLLDAALEAGINTIDTADIYSKWGEGSHAGRDHWTLD